MHARVCWARLRLDVQRGLTGGGMASALVGAIFDMWLDVDRAFVDLSEGHSRPRHGGGSAFAWTLAHIAGFEDGQINVRTRQRERHPVLSDQYERIARESPGSADHWAEIQRALQEVRSEVRAF